MPYFPLIQHYPTVILADGDFPTHPIALQILQEAKTIVCCDGATETLLQNHLSPTAIVGDMDSLSAARRKQFAAIIHQVTEQDTNDLTKAVNFCKQQNYGDITILGATGKREDHTLGNISLLAQYAAHTNVQLITNYGIFVALHQSATLESRAGQQVSLFALQSDAKITTRGLRYPLQNRTLTSWWQGSLNEAKGDSFSLLFKDCNLLVYRDLD
ncbi:thiamine pyrophosphokinase [Bacteroidia bacterium]|nr:thiamine pyrophosphokinase [Bacteroidia bacterium]